VKRPEGRPEREPRHRREFSRETGEKATRKLRARRQGDRGVWFGLGMFGLVGWSVMVPALLGILAGIALDRVLGGTVSWTLTGLVLGVLAGCLNAWYWIKRESGSE
jgi:ATP synthase protein I